MEAARRFLKACIGTKEGSRTELATSGEALRASALMYSIRMNPFSRKQLDEDSLVGIPQVVAD
jgi:hypothetical protein